MLAGIRCIASITLILLLFLSAQYASVSARDLQQTRNEIPKILSALEDSSGNFLILNINSKMPLAAPGIQYLPGPDGQTIMVADFQNVIWLNPSQLIRPANESIESVRLGQFQSNPPIFRISIATSNPSILRKIEFRAKTNSLVIKLRDKSDSISTRRDVYFRPADLQNAPKQTTLTTYPLKNTKIASENPQQPIARSKNLISSTLAGSTITGAEKVPLVATSSSLSSSTSLSTNFSTTGSASRSTAMSTEKVNKPLPFTPGGLFLDVAAKARTDRGFAENTIVENTPKEKSLSLSGKTQAEKTIAAATLPPLAPQLRQKKSSDDAAMPLIAPTIESSETAKDTDQKKRNPGFGSRIKNFLRKEFSDSDDPEDAALTASTNENMTPESKTIESKTLESKTNGKKISADSAIERKTVTANSSLTNKATVKGLLPESKSSMPLAAPSFLPSTGNDGNPNPNPNPDSEAATDIISESAPQIEYSGGNPFVVRMKFASPVKYSSFRLEDPPRFVFDVFRKEPANISKMPASSTPSENPFLKEIRIGAQDGEGKTTRIVLDLAEEVRTAVREDFDPSTQILTLTLQQQKIESASVRGRVVVIDAGHGGSDPGAQRGDIREKEITLAIAQKLKRYMEERGVRVVMTRSDDTFISLEERVRITNETSPDAFISIHINSLETDNDIQGVETYYHNDQSRGLANKVHEQLLAKLEVPNRFVRKARFYVVNHTPHPAILAEVGFISNKDERDKLISSDYQVKIASSVGQGVVLYLSNDSEKTPSTVSPGLPAAAPQFTRSGLSTKPKALARGAESVVKEEVEERNKQKMKLIAQPNQNKGSKNRQENSGKSNERSGNKHLAYKVTHYDQKNSRKREITRSLHQRQIASRRS